MPRTISIAKRRCCALRCSSVSALPDVERILARLLVAPRIELDAEARSELGVAVRVEDAARADQREIDVEQNELRRGVHRPGP